MACKYPTPAFNRRVAIQSPAGSRDAYGELSTTWSTVATVWAAIMPISVRELLAAGSSHGEITHRVQVRYQDALAIADASWRIVFGARIFVLTGPVRNLNEGNRILEFLCVEGERTE